MNDKFEPTHRHYKGKLYEFICLAKHTETNEVLVIYRDETLAVFARPESMFVERLELGIKRFAPL